MRTSKNEVVSGKIKNGFDYELQVWVKDYTIQKCGHKKQVLGFCCHVEKLAGKDIRSIK